MGARVGVGGWGGGFLGSRFLTKPDEKSNWEEYGANVGSRRFCFWTKKRSKAPNVTGPNRGSQGDFHCGTLEFLLLACDLHGWNVEWAYGLGLACQDSQREFCGRCSASSRGEVCVYDFSGIGR